MSVITGNLKNFLNFLGLPLDNTKNWIIIYGMNTKNQNNNNSKTKEGIKMSRTSEKYVLVNKDKLMNLIYKHKCAIRDLAYARGVNDGRNRLVNFLRPAKQYIAEYRETSEAVEAELYDYVLFSDNNNNNEEKGE